jgi:hypothetical protein
VEESQTLARLWRTCSRVAFAGYLGLYWGVPLLNLPRTRLYSERQTKTASTTSCPLRAEIDSLLSLSGKSEEVVKAG